MQRFGMLRVLGGREALLLAACLLASLAFGAVSPVFATPENLVTVLRNCSELLLVSLGMTLLLGMGGVDVSVGMVMGLAAIAVGRALQAGWLPALAGLAGPVVGGLLGLVAGAVVALGRVPAIVGTLGLFGLYRAAVFLTLGGSWLSALPPDLTAMLEARPLGIPVAVLMIACLYGTVWVALRRMPFGLHLLSVGHAEERARLSGVPVMRVRFIAFAISGLLCGFAATFYVATYRNVATTVGGTLALEAIAAVVLGGTAVTGGSCSLLGTALGVLLLRLVQNGLLLVGVPSLWQPVVTGALLLGVLSLEAAQGRLSAAGFGLRPARS